MTKKMPQISSHARGLVVLLALSASVGGFM
jgi:hypothetical protein